MRRMLIVAGALTLASAAPVLANGPSGSTEGAKGTKNHNNVSCGKTKSTQVAGLWVYQGTNGAEICNEGGFPLIQGRIIATTDQGGYVLIDGDRDNTFDENLRGYIRVDAQGAQCEDETRGEYDGTSHYSTGHACP